MKLNEEPHVCCMMLTKDRPEAATAIRAFESQTYRNRSLWIGDSGKSTSTSVLFRRKASQNRYFRFTDSLTIGELRNRMCKHMPEGSLVAHWDDDDWSAPDRLEQQVMVLQANPEKVATGFRSMAFWDTVLREAWAYSHPAKDYIIGTSLMYRRSAWEEKPFEHTNRGEDTRWIAGLDRKAFPGFTDTELLMIGRIHPGNTSDSYAIATRMNSTQWHRAPVADAACRKVFCDMEDDELEISQFHRYRDLRKRGFPWIILAEQGKLYVSAGRVDIWAQKQRKTSEEIVEMMDAWEEING